MAPRRWWLRPGCTLLCAALMSGCTAHSAGSAAPSTGTTGGTTTPSVPTSTSATFGSSPPNATPAGTLSSGTVAHAGSASPSSPTGPTPSSGAPTTSAGRSALVAAKAAQILAEITIPPLPSFTVPTDLLTSAAGRRIAAVLHAQPGLYAGIAVLDDRCTAAGAAPADSGTTATGRAGAGTYNGQGVHVSIAGDGTGTYRDGKLSVSVLTGGGGVYDDGTTRVQVQPGGAGSYMSPIRRITVAADGTGTYRAGGTRLWVNADHSAGYDAGDVHVSVSSTGTVFTHGDPVTTAAVVEVIRHPFPRFPPVPRVAVVHPKGSVCGTVVRLDANVLFDFGSAALSAQGTALVTKVGRLLSGLGYPAAQVNGYTDHIGSGAANLALSRARASVVCLALRASGVPSDKLHADGFGATHPLGPEVTAAGKDDPAARQLDRRVEVVLPTTAQAASTAGGSPAPCS